MKKNLTKLTILALASGFALAPMAIADEEGEDYADDVAVMIARMMTRVERMDDDNTDDFQEAWLC